MALLDRSPEQAAHRFVPGIVGLAQDGCDRRIAGRTQGQLTHDGAQLRLGLKQLADGSEVAAKLVGGRTMGSERRTEALHRVLDYAADERLLARKVVMQGRDVDADLGRDLSGPKTFEATLGDLIERRPNQVLAAILPGRAGLP